LNQDTFQVQLHGVGKKFNKDWVFKNFNMEFISGNSYAILGPNGSGKSTLLQVIAGNVLPTSGDISFVFNGKMVEAETSYQQVSLCAPYLQLIEEMTLTEMITFHRQFKQLPDIDIAETLQLKHANHKEIRQFSSGMKQRVKLGLSILTQSHLLILDEPLTNLDDKGKEWYYHMIQQYTDNKVVLVGSNRQDEYAFCNHQIKIEDYKF
jgi:ABC-type multidrug transport system ATPase subunit